MERMILSDWQRESIKKRVRWYRTDELGRRQGLSTTYLKGFDICERSQWKDDQRHGVTLEITDGFRTYYTATIFENGEEIERLFVDSWDEDFESKISIIESYFEDYGDRVNILKR